VPVGWCKFILETNQYDTDLVWFGLVGLDVVENVT
jgi:hypothetical protein